MVPVVGRGLKPKRQRATQEVKVMDEAAMA